MSSGDLGAQARHFRRTFATIQFEECVCGSLPFANSSWSFLNLQDILPTLTCTSLGTRGSFQSGQVAVLRSEWVATLIGIRTHQKGSDIVSIQKPKIGHGSGLFRCAFQEKRLDSLIIVSSIKVRL